MSTQMQETYAQQCAREQEREAQNRAYFFALLPQVAAAMGEGWIVEEPHPEDRQEMSRTLTGPKLEYCHRPQADPHEIGMDWQKTPALIAKQVKSRLFPAYLPDLIDWRVQVDAANIRLHVSAHARAQIEVSTGLKWYNYLHGQEWRLDGVGVSHWDGQDHFEFRESGLTVAQIIRLCQALAEPKEGK